jgi:hypothetical protein
MKSTKTISTFLGMIVFSIFLMSTASAVIDFTNVTGNNQTVSIGSQATFSFDVLSDNFNETITLNLPNIFGQNTQWSGATGSFSLQSGVPFSRTVTVNIPSNQQSGTYTGLIGATGTTRVVHPLNISLIVSPTQSQIQINTPPSITLISNATQTFTLQNLGATTLSNIVLTETTNFGATFNPSSLSLNSGATSSPINLILNQLRNIKFGTNTLTIKAEDRTAQVVSTKNIELKKTFCSAGPIGSQLEITKIDINNNGEGKDDEWELLDEVEIEVEVRNNDNDDDVDVIIELAVYDSNGRNIADDLEYLAESDSDDEEIEININDDDEEKVTWVFRVPADIDDGNYKLAIKAYSDDDGEDEQCVDSSDDLNKDFYQDISIDRVTDNGRLVIVDDVFMDTQATCSETVTGSFTVFNVGNEDQERVLINMRNSELGINEDFEITSDLDQGEDETISFSFTIPKDAENKLHRLSFTPFYDYKNGNYREEADESTIVFLEVLGCSTQQGPTTGVIISANLETPEVVPGKNIVIKTSVTNLGEDSIFTINTEDYDSWAELISITPNTLSIDSGETGTADITLKIKQGISGTQRFMISSTDSDGKKAQQEVQVNVQSQRNLFGTGFENNSLIWIIGIINIVLIILIIVVAVKLSRR